MNVSLYVHVPFLSARRHIERKSGYFKVGRVEGELDDHFFVLDSVRTKDSLRKIDAGAWDEEQDAQKPLSSKQPTDGYLASAAQALLSLLQGIKSGSTIAGRMKL